LKTFVLMMIMSGLLLVIGLILGGIPLMIVFLVIALGINFFMYWKSDSLALKMANAHPITEQDDRELYGIVAEQAILAGLPMPKVYQIDSDSPNAFATGRNPQHAAVAVTTGIRCILNREELGAVLAHEMAHVGNRDTLIMSVVATMAMTIMILASVAKWGAIMGMMFGGRDRNDGIGAVIGTLVVAMIAGVAATLIRSAISRTREFQADATGAHTSGNPFALASALEKLEQGSQARPMKVAEGASHLFIVNPLNENKEEDKRENRFSMSNLFSTHPPIAERVRRLRDVRPNF
jgi:heat shock protein HtpX